MVIIAQTRARWFLQMHVHISADKLYNKINNRREVIYIRLCNWKREKYRLSIAVFWASKSRGTFSFTSAKLVSYSQTKKGVISFISFWKVKLKRINICSLIVEIPWTNDLPILGCCKTYIWQLVHSTFFDISQKFFFRPFGDNWVKFVFYTVNMFIKYILNTCWGDRDSDSFFVSEGIQSHFKITITFLNRITYFCTINRRSWKSSIKRSIYYIMLFIIY